MRREDREIEHYQLVIEETVESFNDRVNGLIEDGFQFYDEAVRIDADQHGNMMYRTELVRYVPERIMVDPRELMNDRPRTGRGDTQINTIGGDRLRNIPTERQETDRMDTEPVPAPQPPHWTVDSPDPFDDDDVFDEETVNEHQLNRMGMINQPEVDDRPPVTRPLPETMRGELAEAVERTPDRNETLILAARQVMEGQRDTREGREPAENAPREATEPMNEPQAESPF